MSVNNEAKTTKLVTQWNISAIPYSSGSAAFEGSYMEEWLNDTTVDGFLGNLRDYENFIVTDAKWNATLDATDLGSIERPSDNDTIVTASVGLLNAYEYQSASSGNIIVENEWSIFSTGYLNNGLYWLVITPETSSYIRSVDINGNVPSWGSSSTEAYGVRPSISLKSNVKIVDGDGTVDNPYRLKGDNDTNLSGTLLNTRYSGEYIKFGNDENNLYRIVSHENGTGTKIVSAQPLKDSGAFITSAFGSSSIFSSTNTIGTFLNGDYLNSYIDMIEENTTWYLGTVGEGTSYKLAKYTDETGNTLTSSTTDAKIGLLRMGELMAGQFEKYYANESTTGLTTTYWTLTPHNLSVVRKVDDNGGGSNYGPSNAFGVKPSLNLKQNVVITSGNGTKNNPFTVELS